MANLIVFVIILTSLHDPLFAEEHLQNEKTMQPQQKAISVNIECGNSESQSATPDRIDMKLSSSASDPRALYLDWPLQKICKYSSVEVNLNLNENAKNQLECDTMNLSDFHVHMSREYFFKRNSSKKSNDGKITFHYAPQGCYYAHIIFKKNNSNDVGTLESKRIFVYSKYTAGEFRYKVEDFVFQPSSGSGTYTAAGKIRPKLLDPFRVKLALAKQEEGICADENRDLILEFCDMRYTTTDTPYIYCSNNASCKLIDSNYECTFGTKTTNENITILVQINDGRCNGKTKFPAPETIEENCCFDFYSTPRSFNNSSIVLSPRSVISPNENSEEQPKIYLEMILLMVAAGIAIACFAYKVSCRLLNSIRQNGPEEKLPVIRTIVRRNTQQRLRNPKILLLYARQDKEFMKLAQEFREKLQIRLACEVVDINHKDYEHILHTSGFEFVEDFLHIDSCFNAHHDVKIIMIHTDWSSKIYEAQMTKCKIKYKDAQYIDSYYTEALRILMMEPENVDYQKIFHIVFEDYPLTKPMNRPKLNSSPVYHYPNELDLFCQAIKSRPLDKFEEETNEDTAETAC